MANKTNRLTAGDLFNQFRDASGDGMSFSGFLSAGQQHGLISKGTIKKGLGSEVVARVDAGKATDVSPSKREAFLRDFCKTHGVQYRTREISKLGSGVRHKAPSMSA